MNPLLARSYLFVPANRPERFAKACAAGADAVIIDLEDAVPPLEKAAARDHLAHWLSPANPVVIRINGAQSDWFANDVALCAMPGVAGIMLPKAETVDEINIISCASAQKPVLPLIETALGMRHAELLAGAPHVQRLVFGTVDFQFELGLEGDGEELLFYRSQLVLASRLAGIQAPVDGVTTDIDNHAALLDATVYARRLGFGAKLCIHPRQLAPVHAGFAPTEAQLDWSRRVVQAAHQADGAAIAVDGKMVDRPVILKAQQMLMDAERRAHRNAVSAG